LLFGQSSSFFLGRLGAGGFGADGRGAGAGDFATAAALGGGLLGEDCGSSQLGSAHSNPASNALRAPGRR
ncbi:MAG TPA: hypothetical protein VGJ84_01530, partial [Polyangiaceae bacterium]